MSTLLQRWPRWARPVSLRARLALGQIVILGLVLLAFSTLVTMSFARVLQSEADAILTAEAQQANDLVDIDEGKLVEAIPTERVPAGLVMAVYNQQGRLLFSNDTQSVLPRLASERFKAGARADSFETIRQADGSGWRVAVIPIIDDGQALGLLHVARSQQTVEQALGQLLTLLAVGVPIILVLAGVAGLLIAGRTLAPVERLIRTTELIKADDLTRRLPVPPQHDEVGRLALTFNRLLDRLERAFQRQRQFTADASHELRTPLAMLASQADVTLARPRQADEYCQALTSMREDIERMNVLVGQLLMLARADAGQEQLTRERLDLDNLINDTVMAMVPLAEAQGITLAHNNGQGVPIIGDQTRLTQLVINLVDNAIKYTPAGGQVTVGAQVVDDKAWFEVSDTGPGIAPEHLPHLFERFYRVDLARSRARGGTGLGLAICRWVVEAHQGEIMVNSQLGRGTRVTVTLPLRREPTPSSSGGR